MADAIRIQTQDFDVSEELALMRRGDGRVGAVCCFVGTVREAGGAEAVREMELEHYPGMTESAIAKMVDEARRRFEVLSSTVIHRVGVLEPEDQIVLVAVTSPHRRHAFEACEFLMDYLKTQAPFWKKETTHSGAHWVDARDSDDAALMRWGIQASNAPTP